MRRIGPHERPHQAHVDGRHRAVLDRLRHLRRRRRPEVDPELVEARSRAGATARSPTPTSTCRARSSTSSSTRSITETTFPALDGASQRGGVHEDQDPAGERSSRRSAPAPRSRRRWARSRRRGSPSAFRLSIDGLDEMKYTNKIESFTIKQGVKKLYTGSDRFPEIEPTKIEFPNLDRHDRARVRRQAAHVEPGLPRQGPEGLRRRRRPARSSSSRPTRARRCSASTCSRSACSNATIMQSTANSDQIKRVKFELYVGRMELDGGGALGLE